MSQFGASAAVAEASKTGTTAGLPGPVPVEAIADPLRLVLAEPDPGTAPEKVGFGFGHWLQIVRLAVQPIILGVLAPVLWHACWLRGWYPTPLGASPIENAVLPAIVVAHIWIFTKLMGEGNAEARAMVRCVIQKDKPGSKEEFLILVRTRTPAPMKVVLFITMNMVAVWTIFGLHYETYWMGFAATYSMAYTLWLLWEVVADIDDPFRGVWIIQGVPEDWRKEADQYIKPRLSDRIFERIFGVC